MCKRLSLRLFILVWLLACPALCWGWGKEGHEIVGVIAESRLSVNAKREIRKLVGDEHLFDDSVAVWADTNKTSVTGPWHYVDIPVTEKAFDRKRDGVDGNNVVDQTIKFAKIVADQTKPAAQRTEALRYLVHFLGDIHQPLHCAQRNSTAGVPDRGGNECSVHFLDSPARDNLHRVWDTDLVKAAMNGKSAQDYGAALAKRITPEQAAKWGDTAGKDLPQAVEGWANESLRAAVEHVYKDVPADGTVVTLGKAYVDQAKPVADEQLMKAGVRLANLLNEAFP